MEQVTIISLAKGYSPLFSLYGNKFILDVLLSLSLSPLTDQELGANPYSGFSPDGTR